MEASTSTLPALADLVNRGAKRTRAVYGRELELNDEGLERA
jgi:hypothetical protein